jgi:hypothetical protein
MSTPFLDLVVDTWAAQGYAGARYEVKRTPDSTALIVEIETPRVLATIEAWEAARCLDVTTLDLATGQGTIHSAGETINDEEMLRRLDALGDILQAYEVRNEV